MTVLYNQRTLPLAANASNTAFSANVDLAYDFTGIGALASSGGTYTVAPITLTFTHF